MGGILQVIFFIWIGWIVLVVTYHVVVGLFEFLKEVLGSFFDSPALPYRPASRQSNVENTQDSRKPDGTWPKFPTPSGASAQSTSPQVIQLGAVPPVPTLKRPAKLELTVDYNARLAGSSYLVVRVRGGPDGGRVGGITYAFSCNVNLQQQDYALGDRRSPNIIPEAFKGHYKLNTPLPEDDSWATLAVIPLEQVLPPRGLRSRYQFKCLAYASAGRDYVGSPSPVGHVLIGADFSTIFTLPGPGYLDEMDWLSLREKLLIFIEGLIQGCQDDVSDKRSKVRSFVESLTPPFTTSARVAILKVAIGRIYLSVRPSPAIDFGIIEDVRMSNDAALVEALAKLTFHLACREPLSSEVRKAFDMIQATYDVNVIGHHIRDIAPLPPSAPVIIPSPMPAPAIPPFELKLEPIDEVGRVKAAEVYVRGFSEGLLMPHPELTYWLWDETAGDEPFLVSSADIDQVHERAVHHHAWKKDEYDPSKWQSAGVVRFNRFMPPAGGSRRISVAASTGAKMIIGFFNPQKTARSTAVVMPIACPGYKTIRNARHGLRYRAFVLALGLALLSGKGPTYRQDKALKKFAQTLCDGITDRKLGVCYQNDLLTLLDSNVDDSLSGLTRQLDQLAAQAYPELKSQLLEAFVEVMASRKVRSKESRNFLEYSRGVLA